SSRRLDTSERMSAGLNLRMSLDFIVNLAGDHLHLHGKLVADQAERFTRLRFGDAGHFEEHPAGLDDGDPVIHGAFTLTHAHFERLLRDRLVGENPDVDPPPAPDVPAHGYTAGFDVVCPHPAGFHGHEGVVTERDVVASFGGALHAAPHHFAVFDSFRQQHCSALLLTCGA